MPVADDFRALADQTIRELDAVHDFYDHSQIVWLSFQVQASEGYKVAFTNLATGNAVDQDGLVRLSPDYTRIYLATFTFRHIISTFEVFLFDFLHLLFQHNPWPFARKQLDFETVLLARDREEIISSVIVKQLNDLKYDRLREWFEAMNKAVALGCPSSDEIDALSEVKATRDILEHNAGVVNETYRRKAGTKARYSVGDRIEIEDAYHLESWRLIKKVVADITAAALAKVGNS